MTAGPRDPGVGENRYQPASSYEVPDGTCTVPSAFNPRDRSDEWTPIDGMSIAYPFVAQRSDELLHSWSRDSAEWNVPELGQDVPARLHPV
jgi:hypothetical protein